MKPVVGRVHAQGLGAAEGLEAPRFGTAAEVVRHLGCVQSQLHDMALWSVARRLHGATLVDLQQSFDAGDFLRTHVLRPTWHFVDPADIYWLQALTGPRVRRLVETTNRTLGLTPEAMDRGIAVVVDALADGRPRTRAELATAVAGAGLPTSGQAMAHIVMGAEIEALVASGPMLGKQHTYRLLPAAPTSASRDELLGDVARRYARGHGPIRAKDLAWWTSLTVTDSRRAIELGGLRPAATDDHWQLDDPVEAEVPHVMLLSNFDEYISYARDAEDYADFAGTTDELMRGAGLVLVDGRLAGMWSRTVTARRVDIDVRPTPRITASLRRGLDAEAAAFGMFLGREPVLRIVG